MRSVSGRGVIMPLARRAIAMQKRKPALAGAPTPVDSAALLRDYPTSSVVTFPCMKRPR
jgi:hypothetical protein